MLPCHQFGEYHDACTCFDLQVNNACAWCCWCRTRMNCALFTFREEHVYVSWYSPKWHQVVPSYLRIPIPLQKQKSKPRKISIAAVQPKQGKIMCIWSDIIDQYIYIYIYIYIVFCKDNRLVLIVECLFAKASTANAGAELLKLRPLLREQQLICIKATYSNTACFGSYPKSVNFNKL